MQIEVGSQPDAKEKCYSPTSNVLTDRKMCLAGATKGPAHGRTSVRHDQSSAALEHNNFVDQPSNQKSDFYISLVPRQQALS